MEAYHTAAISSTSKTYALARLVLTITGIVAALICALIWINDIRSGGNLATVFPHYAGTPHTMPADFSITVPKLSAFFTW